MQLQGHAEGKGRVRTEGKRRVRTSLSQREGAYGRQREGAYVTVAKGGCVRHCRSGKGRVRTSLSQSQREGAYVTVAVAEGKGRVRTSLSQWPNATVVLRGMIVFCTLAPAKSNLAWRFVIHIIGTYNGVTFLNYTYTGGHILEVYTPWGYIHEFWIRDVYCTKERRMQNTSQITIGGRHSVLEKGCEATQCGLLATRMPAAPTGW